MVRIKLPGGGEPDPRPVGWLLDDAADHFADGTLRITSRQGIQYHHVYGPKLAPLVRHLNRGYRDPRDPRRLRRREPQRHVLAHRGPRPGARDRRARELAGRDRRAELAPRTGSYFQVFLSDDDGTQPSGR